MVAIKLVKHDLQYAQRMFQLSSAAPVRDALGLQVKTVSDTERFIHYILEAEQAGRELSRVILNEKDELIGVTTLMKLDDEHKRCHIGSWLGHAYWGQGYNQAAKIAILRIAFEELGLEHVLAGARKVNIRSQKAQEKLPYIRLHVESQFPEELQYLEAKEKQPCVLHAFYREDFMTYCQETQK